MNTDCRALCAELIEAVLADDSRLDILDIARRARTALAEPVGEGVTDEELWQVGDEDFRANTWPTDAIRYARAVLARYGHQPAPPAAGEAQP